MALINRTQMLCDLKDYLPDANALSDILLSNTINNVIDHQIPDGQTAPIDDDIYYSEDLCKSLKASALLNKGKYSADVATLRKEKVDDVELEYSVSAARYAWDDFVKSLADVCPYLPGGGYKPKKAIGARINPSNKFVIDNCTCTTTTCTGSCSSIFNPCQGNNIYF